MLRLSAQIATKILFGEEAAGRDDRHGPERTAEAIWELVASPLTQLAPFDLPGLPYRRFVDLVTTWDTQMREIIANKRSSLVTDHPDVLSTLITARDEESGASLTEDELVGHVGSMFGAAHETVASALAWTVLLLSQHPLVASDLLDELEGELRGDAPTMEQLSKLSLLDRVVKESLRVIPPVPVTWRIAAESVEVGGYHVPQGAEVYASGYHTHHMPEFYSDPQAFQPRRWEGADPATYEYIPFGAGPRRCLGDAFGLLEMKIVLSMLLQRFRLACPLRIKVDRVGFPVIRPKGGLPMTIRAQDHQFDRPVNYVSGNVRDMVALP
jgi:cytochrome P450